MFLHCNLLVFVAINFTDIWLMSTQFNFMHFVVLIFYICLLKNK